MSDEMVGRQEMSSHEELLDCRRAHLVPITVMKSPSSLEVFVEVISSGMSISNTLLGSIVVGTVRVDEAVESFMGGRNETQNSRRTCMICTTTPRDKSTSCKNLFGIHRSDWLCQKVLFCTANQSDV